MSDEFSDQGRMDRLVMLQYERRTPLFDQMIQRYQQTHPLSPQLAMMAIFLYILFHERLFL